MANISTYLNQIMSAIYGKDVRKSIHDAISAMNTESSNAMAYAAGAKDSAASAASEAKAAQSSATSSASSAATSASQAKAAQLAAENAKSDSQNARNVASSSASSASTSAGIAQTNANAAQSARNEIDEKVADVMTMKNNLINFHSIFHDLTDSQNAPILDSSGNRIQGKTVYADAQDILDLKKTIDSLVLKLNNLNSISVINRIESLEKKMDESVNRKLSI